MDDKGVDHHKIFLDTCEWHSLSQEDNCGLNIWWWAPSIRWLGHIFIIVLMFFLLQWYFFLIMFVAFCCWMTFDIWGEILYVGSFKLRLSQVKEMANRKKGNILPKKIGLDWNIWSQPPPSDSEHIFEGCLEIFGMALSFTKDYKYLWKSLA